MQPKRILITNAYSWLNKGDACIIIAMASFLKRQWPSIEISVVSLTSDVDRFYYDKYGLNVIPDFFFDILHSNTCRLLKILELAKTAVQVAIYIIFYRVGYDLKGVLAPNKYKIIHKYLDADLVISSGGGFINDAFGSVFLLHLLQLAVSIGLGKPTMICAQSIGPMRGRIYRFITKLVLNKLDLITVRETFSKELLREMNVKTSTYVTADMTFALSQSGTSDSNFDLHKQESPQIGITVRKWVYPGSSNSDEKNKKYVEAFSQLVDYLVEKMGASIFFIPQVIGPRGDDDRKFADVVYRQINHKEKVKVLTSDLSPFEIMQFISKLDLFIGTRMHSNIFAIMSHVPTIAISYEYKTDGIMKMLGLEQWVIPIERVTAVDLISKVNSIWEERTKLTEQLLRKSIYLRKRALLNIQLINDFWQSMETETAKSRK